MRKELRWGVSDFSSALVSSNFPANARGKVDFAAAGYKDSEVSKSYFSTGYLRQFMIEMLNLGNNKL
jgi:hypothetical protein